MFFTLIKNSSFKKEEIQFLGCIRRWFLQRYRMWIRCYADCKTRGQGLPDCINVPHSEKLKGSNLWFGDKKGPDADFHCFPNMWKFTTAIWIRAQIIRGVIPLSWKRMDIPLTGLNKMPVSSKWPYNKATGW